MPKPLDRRLRNREHDAKRRTEQPWRAWYKTKAWVNIRARKLAEQPLCERCAKRNLVRAATVVHHAEKHNGVWAKFIGGPFESLCFEHHDQEAQSEEKRGYSNELDASGMPVDHDHPFNR